MSDALRCIRHLARKRAPIRSGTPIRSVDDGRLENTGGRHRRRLSDRRGCLRTALRARLFSHAPVAPQPLGPRCLRACARGAKPALGNGAADCRRDCRPVRRNPCAVRRRHSLCARPCADGARDKCGGAGPVGWRADRLRSLRHHLSDRACGVRQDTAGRVALDRFRSRNGGGLFRPVPVFALAVFLMDLLGWQNALVAFGVVILVVLPASLTLAAPSSAAGASPAASQSLREALSEALGHRSYVLLMLGFFTCGFQLAFITVHLPAYLADRGLSSDVGGWTLAAIGLFNIVGALSAGWLSERMPKRHLLSLLYFGRAATIFVFIMFPITAFTCIVFGATMGLMWLSTVPPTNGIIVVMFGTRWLATL